MAQLRLSPRTLLLAAFLLAFLPLTAAAQMQIPTVPGQSPAVPPPPPPPEDDDDLSAAQEQAEWYISPAGKALGPYSVGQLIEMAAKGEINGGTAVWKPGMADWKRLREMPELAQVAAAVPGEGKKEALPPAPNTQEMLDKEYAAFMVGTWYLEGPYIIGDAYYHVVVEIAYRSDGTFAGRQATSVALESGGKAPPYVSARRGIYKVTGIDDNHFVLTTIDQGQPPRDQSFEVLDRNTLRNMDLNLTVYRIR